ncbi:MAG TPA: M14 family metallopeptidase [Candidatus Aminicenantes bacterium]|nr:M14 family metallopeptidase [Candidatus Aminicenantes bacterium]HRY66055.1 M14 family metallopeptidase [Candidatus Aminicenantes bacterium]HRZ72896.1 M14 family metallopeptidase [Candidatus Aminicenantes bacterium]
MKKALLAACAALALVPAVLAGTDSLSRLFKPGQAVLDLDGDGFPEKPALAVIVPDKPTPAELALAADIAARTNFESLAVDFGLVRRESDLAGVPAASIPVFVGGRLTAVREALRDRSLTPADLAPNQGRIVLFERAGRASIACLAGSDETLLRTGRAFFLRWPYFWEIWGREAGATYEALEKDLAAFLAAAGLESRAAIVSEALYEFPAAAPVSDGLEALAFDQGQVKDLAVEVRLAAAADVRKAEEALLGLAAAQRRGERTSVLSYPGCAALTLELRGAGAARARVGLPRTGATKRLLTPRFKERPPVDPAGREFDLRGLLSTGAAYGDQDKDGIPDALDAVIVAPRDAAGLGLAELASRLVLGTAGASFPIVQSDSEIESRRALLCPILVGENALADDLARGGKLERPGLGPGTGAVQIVPQAFGKSSAAVVSGGDAAGLDRTMSYLARTFPHFAAYGQGQPQLADLAADLDSFLAGGKGAAEAFAMNAVNQAAAEIKGRLLESVQAEIVLPAANAPFEAAVGEVLRRAAGGAPVSVAVSSLRTGRTVFEKKREFSWEADDAKALLRDRLKALVDAAGKGGAVEVSIGLSESPAVRQKVRDEVRAFLAAAGFPAARVEVLSAYKPGFFWLVEKVLPALKGLGVDRLTVRFAESRQDLSRLQRAYAEPGRWLQELYPVDEILARDLGLPIDRIVFEKADPGGPTYAVEAADARGRVVYAGRFSPRTRLLPLSAVLPEWGTAEATTGWLRAAAGGTVVCDQPLATDLEKFWDFYQADVLAAVAGYVREKTGGQPTFSKQPYFKRLLVDLRASEPDYRIGVDQEMISSLEAIHDEIYFDTLDLMRGLTRFDPDSSDAAADTSRSSAPGNVFPSLHPSLEGGPAAVRVVLEDWPAPSPRIVLRWKEKAREEISRASAFPALKPKETRFSTLVYDGRSGRVADVVVESEWEKEADYLAFVDLAAAWRGLFEAGLVAEPFRFPSLDGVTLRARWQTRKKDERLPVSRVAGPDAAAGVAAAPAPPPADRPIVTIRDIITPDAAVDLVRRLAALPGVRAYAGGRSFEGREVPVVELFLPDDPYVSLPRLVTAKPTLQAVARQHANEVSSTNYLLRFAELLARDPAGREALKTVSFAFEPLENPDGAALAAAMVGNEPFHSLHAGRYGALGVDMGAQIGTKPILPEAAVRTRLYDRWAPDIVLNLHGYPSHEWVQPFSNYTPYLFRDYWIPRGWYTYFESLRLPLYPEHRAEAEALRKLIAAEFGADPALAASNRRFYDRYERWAGRWAPHQDALEVADGIAVYAKRRGPVEGRMTPRTRTTFNEQSPEIMDETASGDWLEFLCAQGLAYLRAHVKYLRQAAAPVVRIEEEIRGRTRITLVRPRPGGGEKT